MNITDAPEIGDNSDKGLKKDRNSFFNRVETLGGQEAKGLDALPRLAAAVVEASMNGAINLDKDTAKQDDAHRISDRYIKGKGAAGQYATTQAKKVNTSKVRTFIKLGKWTAGNPADVLHRTFEIQKQAATNKENVYPAYDAAVAMARVQLKTAQELTDAEIADAIAKPARADKEVVDVVDGIRKQLEKLITGERPDHLQSQHTNVIAAHDALRDYVNEMREEGEKATIMQMAAAHGLTLVPATSDEVDAEAA